MYFLPKVSCCCQTLKNSLHKVDVPSSPWVCLSLPHDPNTVVLLSFLPDSWIEGSQPGFPFWLYWHCFPASLFSWRLKDCVWVCVPVRVFICMYHSWFISPGQCRERDWILYKVLTQSLSLWWQHRLEKHVYILMMFILKMLKGKIAPLLFILEISHAFNPKLSSYTKYFLLDHL